MVLVCTNFHFDVFIHNLIKGGFWHSLYCLQCSREVHAISRRKATFGYVFCTDLSCKVIQSSKEISVYLLQTFHAPGLCRFQQSTLKELVGFLLALPVNSIIAVCEPVNKSYCFDIGYCFCQQNNTFSI